MVKTSILRIAKVRDVAAAMALTWSLACGTAFAQTAPEASTAAPQNSLKLVRVIVALPAGAPWLRLSTDGTRGMGFCANMNGVYRTWTGGREPQELAPYAATFKTELEKAGYKIVTPGEDNLFDPESGSADYEAAAVITDEQIDGCISQGGLFTARGAVMGHSTMTVDWQIYSPIRKQVVARVSTSGAKTLFNSEPGGVARLITASFATNLDQLATKPEFRAALSAPRPLAKGFVMPGQQSKVMLAGSLKAPARQISDAVGSVVTLMTGDGSGSGILLSDDGYLITNAHVVGEEKELRVRWSDGIETVGQVVRVAKDRDVAIVKTSARDRMPLAIKRGAVDPGQRVYAIGSPKGKNFQGTVSSGVVSATRIFDGLRFIQSDVSVSPGSSSGPLVDETGSVIGITVLGVDNGGRAGLNLFIPIGDAMDFLSLEQQ